MPLYSSEVHALGTFSSLPVLRDEELMSSANHNLISTRVSATWNI
jgi:hypothetical protein